MKKVYSLIATLAALAGSATAAPYYMPQPAGGALTPYDIQPVFSIEALYNVTQNKDYPDTYGARLNLSLYNNGESSVRHQVSISAGYEYGRERMEYEGIRYKDCLESLPLTLGYDINISLTDNIMLDLGAKAGYAFGTETLRLTSPSTLMGRHEVSENMQGFTYSLGAGLKVQFSESIYMKLGYEFSRTFYDGYGNSTLNLNQHGVVLGVGCLF